MASKFVIFNLGISLVFTILSTTEINGNSLNLNPLNKNVNYYRHHPTQSIHQPKRYASGNFTQSNRHIFHRVNLQNGTESKNLLSSSGEFLIGTGYSSAPYDQETPAVSFDGTNYFAAWQDWRGDGGIYGARVNQFGVILDTNGILISEAIDYPSVAFDGTNYFVVWSAGHTLGARVSTAGQVLDPIAINICPTSGQCNPSLAFDGINYLVVWEDYRRGEDSADIYGARVRPDGMILDSNGIAISTAANDQWFPRVAFDGTNYLVVWQDYRSGCDIYGTRVNPNGTVLDTNGIAISTATLYQWYPTLAFDGTNYLTVWEDWRSGGSSDIYGARVSPAGVVLDPNGIAISTSVSYQWYPFVTFDGINHFVVWEDMRNGNEDIYSARVNPNGMVLDPNGIAISTATYEQWFPSLTFGENNYLVLWQDWRSGCTYDIYGTRVSQAGIILDSNAFIISTAFNEQLSPSVAFDGMNYFVVWEDEGNMDILATRVNQTGEVLDSAGIIISNSPYEQVKPKVGFDGTNYLVVWQDWRFGSYDIYGTRVNQTGAILEPNGIPISSALGPQYSPCIAFDGINYLVVWEDQRNLANFDIYAARVSPTGFVLDPVGFAVSTATNSQWSPSVAFDGTNYLVVWQDTRNGILDIYCARVNPAGVILDPDGIVISTAPNSQSSPSVTYDGTNYFVVWEDQRNYDIDIYGARVTRAGIVLDTAGIVISTAPGYQRAPSVIFDGTNYLIVWQDGRSGDSYDIYAARVNPSGVVLYSFLVSNQAGDQVSLALARGPENQALITYSGWTDTVQSKRYNSMRIWGKFYTAPWATRGWMKKADVTGNSKRVKHGGCLTVIEDKIYALVGNNTRDFMVYDINANTWTKKSEVPFSASGKQKRVKKGACITNDGNYIYVIKGANTQEFYRYNPVDNTWIELNQPGFTKGIRGGSMVSNGRDLIYLISGTNNNEWKVYNINSGDWSSANPSTLPAGKWRYGSFIIHTDDKVYGLRVGGKTNEFYKLDFSTQMWMPVESMPLVGKSGKRKRARQGASGAFAGNFIYALKGGNTYEFYAYNIQNDEWTQLEDIGQPIGVPAKKVKRGGSLVFSPFAGGLFAFVGNNTNEFWFYNIVSPPNIFSNIIDKSIKDIDNETNRLTIVPNPAINVAAVKYSLLVPGPVHIKLYNVTGKLVKSYTITNPAKDGVFFIDAKALSSGVYILRFNASDIMTTRKMVVEK
ncbi:MAG: T9SS type A sorting domain-containing protein [candidate division WOR-3 bacterium]|nr:T9SS type A sorting domain-containing protein [candidate division WOR-3 bacterium]